MYGSRHFDLLEGVSKEMNNNLDGKNFAPISNTENGDTDGSTVFRYRQEGNIVWADYEGGQIVKGHLIGKLCEDGRYDLRYHHLDIEGEFKFGKCLSTPVLLADGRLKLEEHWQWLSGDMSEGYSEIVEMLTDKQ